MDNAVEWDIVFGNILKTLNKAKDSYPMAYYSEIMGKLSHYTNKELLRASNWLVANHDGWKMPTLAEWRNAVIVANDISPFQNTVVEKIEISEEQQMETKSFAAMMADKYTKMAQKDGLLSGKADSHNKKIAHSVIERRKQMFRDGYVKCKTCNDWVKREDFKIGHVGHKLGFMQWLEKMRKSRDETIKNRESLGLVHKGIVDMCVGIDSLER